MKLENLIGQNVTYRLLKDLDRENLQRLVVSILEDNAPHQKYQIIKERNFVVELRLLNSELYAHIPLDSNTLIIVALMNGYC